MDKISALMDGELDAHQSAQQYSRLKHDANARECWNTYHLIGDALRGESSRINVAGRLSERLAAEPTILAPRRLPTKRVATYALSAAASLSAVALVGWVAINNPLAPQPEPPSVATAPKAVPVTPVLSPAPAAAPAQLANVPSDGKMNEYLMAHQGFSPSTAIQGLAPYIRTVSAHTGKGQE
jgi:sigma-E factor negative regulatory protein RseA